MSLLSQSTRDAIDQWIAKYPAGKQRAAVIAALHIVQRENKGWLTEPLMNAVADYLQLPPISVYEVVSFYGMYDTSPVGKHKIKVCNNISCMLRGSESILEHLQNSLQIKIGETTQDGCFTLYETECLAACGGAPAMQIDDQAYYEDLTNDKIDHIIQTLKNKGGQSGQ